MADQINRRFARAPHPSIVLKVEHHQPEDIFEHYRAAQLCMVTSLHDGMNLVAKEFVSARDDERGVLILSHFTGASRELPEALMVNPYDTDQCAGALQMALTMPAGEQRARMRVMRGLVQEFNVYRWAGRMLIDAAALSVALNAGQLAGAALDVQDPEPPDLSQPPYNDPRVIVTPHAAFVSEESLENLRTRVARQVATRLTGGVPENVVNGVR